MPKITRYAPTISDENPVVATGFTKSNAHPRGELEAVISFDEKSKYFIDETTLTIEDEHGEFVTLNLKRLGLKHA